MQYVRRSPAPPLDRYIDDLYCLSGTPRHRRLVVPPMPSAHLMLNLAGPVVLADSDPTVPPAVLTDAWFTGLWSRRFAIEHRSPVHVVGVHFKPWGMAGFVGVPMHELRDRWVPLDAVWPDSADQLRDRLASVPTDTDRLTLLEGELLRRWRTDRPASGQLVDAVAERVAASWGAVPVSALADRAGVSANHLAARFRAHVGLTPKRVARIYRFARLVLSVDAGGPVPWASLAQDAGYFDQTHLGKEFREFTGLTPTAYVALRRRHPAQPGFPPDQGPIPVE